MAPRLAVEVLTARMLCIACADRAGEYAGDESVHQANRPLPLAKFTAAAESGCDAQPVPQGLFFFVVLLSPILID